MCLIIAVEESRKMSADDLEAAIESAIWFNSDGIGITYAEGGKAKIEKTVVGYDTVIERALDIYQNTRDPFILHLRYNTVGSSTKVNAHPFRITDSIAMAHNKTLKIEPANKGWSDSRTVAELLARMCKGDKSFFGSPLFYSFIEHQAGKSNRFAFFDACNKSITYINEQLGTFIDGIWFSNMYSWMPEEIGISPKSKQNRVRERLESIPGDFNEEDSAFDPDCWEDDIPLAWGLPSALDRRDFAGRSIR
jgi:hypothetical protein